MKSILIFVLLMFCLSFRHKALTSYILVALFTFMAKFVRVDVVQYIEIQLTETVCMSDDRDMVLFLFRIFMRMTLNLL